MAFMPIEAVQDQLAQGQHPEIVALIEARRDSRAVLASRISLQSNLFTYVSLYIRPQMITMSRM